ncbi:MAG: TatD family hydrolase [Isosphaeraceae bacterium]
MNDMNCYIDPHIHMVSRTTDDYKRMALAGCVMVSEPAFWAGFDRSGPEGFRDYFRQLTDHETKRAALYGIRHYCWLCINAKEAENLELSRAVIAMIPEFLDSENVLGIGEIGLNKNTRNESIIFQEHLDLAARHEELVLVHTPHLVDKYQGTRMILDMIKDDPRIAPDRVLIDHVEEHTIRLALDAGHWVGMTLYPTTKCTPARAADMIEFCGAERVLVNSAGDWGHSDPLAVPEFLFEMRSRGHDDALLRKIVHDNPLAFFSKCRRFRRERPSIQDTPAAAVLNA